MRRIKILIIIMLLVIALGMINTVNGAVAIKEAGSQKIVEQTLSNFYDMSLQMKNVGQGLEGTQDNVEPHLVTNTEWAVVSYFSNSNYGTSGEGLKSLTINGNAHNSTNGNATGIMDWGRTWTATAGYVSNGNEDVDPRRKYGESLFAENVKYVDIMSSIISEKYAIKNGKFNSDIYICRVGLFKAYSCDGNAGWSTTFRPTIWN